jgi:hypothetical protein
VCGLTLDAWIEQGYRFHRPVVASAFPETIHSSDGLSNFGSRRQSEFDRNLVNKKRRWGRISLAGAVFLNAL